ncbi:cation transporter [Deltaproteobacteria bacterium TL4]
MSKQHRPGLQKGYLVTRTLKLEGLTSQNKEVVFQQLDQLGGIDEVSIVEEKKLLRVAYDGSKLGIDDIEKILIAHGCGFAVDWWNRLKLGGYRFTDQNIRDNAAHVPQCCSEPPKQEK